jgi:hypothetical protein
MKISRKKTLLPRMRMDGEAVPFPEVIGPTHGSSMPNCPCCNRSSSTTTDARQTLDVPAMTTQRGNSHNYKSLLDADEDEDETLAPHGVLPSGVEYRIRRILVEGWVHKKGTGKDFMRSRAWKPRWAKLAVCFCENCVDE